MPSVLNVGGHPKDCLIYSGGTAAKHAARGDKVTNLAVTHGVRWTHWRAVDRLAEGEKPDFEALIEEKRNEFTAASNELGVTDVRFMGLDDEVLLVERDTIDKIADIIEEIKPDVIITHWPYDSVMTHANATLMVLQALDAVRLRASHIAVNAGMRIGDFKEFSERIERVDEALRLFLRRRPFP